MQSLPQILTLIMVGICLFPSSMGAEILMQENFSSSGRWTSVLPASGFALHFNTGGGGKTRFIASGSPGPTAVERFAYAYYQAPVASNGKYNQVLSLSLAPRISWKLTMNNSQNGPRGNVYDGNPTDGTYDVGGLVLAGSDNNIYSNGVGYGVSFSAGDVNAMSLTLFRYEHGLSGNVTELLDWRAADNSNSGLENIGTKEVVISLDYFPRTNQWTLSGNRMGSVAFGAAFTNPIGVGFGPNDSKSVIDSTYTGNVLSQLAIFYSCDEHVNEHYYDNLYMLTAPFGTVFRVE